MDIQGRLLQSLRRRKDGLLLRSNLGSFGGASQVSVALKSLQEKGLVVKIGHGVYAKPSAVSEVGKALLLQTARAKHERLSKTRSTSVARYVSKLAKASGVSFTPTFADQWAAAVTKLAGDEISSDKTDDLLVALARAGKLSGRDMVKLVMAHHRTPSLAKESLKGV